MSPSSIAHLEEVARHPLISYEVQAVRVHLNYFSAELATDITRFTERAVRHLEDGLDLARALLAPKPAIEKAELILIAWLGFLRRTEASVENPDILEEVIAESRAMVGLAKA